MRVEDPMMQDDFDGPGRASTKQSGAHDDNDKVGKATLTGQLGTKATASNMRPDETSATTNEATGAGRWDYSSGKPVWKGPWPVSRLMAKEQSDKTPEKFVAPPVLHWNATAKKYEASGGQYRFEIQPAKNQKAKIPLLKTWHWMASDYKLPESQHIIASIIDVIDDGKGQEMAIFAYADHILMGVAIYEFNGELELAPEIPEQHERWLYLTYTAANPGSQKPAHQRTGGIGGAGAAINSQLEAMGSELGMPIFTHAENAISYVAFLRSGYHDVNAAKDQFDVPRLA
jgi:hypothetical protein